MLQSRRREQNKNLIEVFDYQLTIMHFKSLFKMRTLFAIPRSLKLVPPPQCVGLSEGLTEKWSSHTSKYCFRYCCVWFWDKLMLFIVFLSALSAMNLYNLLPYLVKYLYLLLFIPCCFLSITWWWNGDTPGCSFNLCVFLWSNLFSLRNFWKYAFLPFYQKSDMI